MKFINLIIIILAILCLSIGCGGSSGGNGNNIDVNLNQLAGTYSLIGFSVEYDNGTTITEDDVSSYSGTMTIKSDGNMTQDISVNGVELSFSGTYSIISSSKMRVTSGGCTYTIGYSFNNNVFTTYAESGTCGIDYSETDVWQKTSSIIVIDDIRENNKIIHRDINNIGYVKNIGGLIGQHVTPYVD